MKRLKTIILFILTIQISLCAQIDPKVKSIVKGYPKSFNKYEKLAERINADFTSESDKAAAIYNWMALHITYDVQSLFSKSKTYSYSYSSEAERLKKETQYKNKIALSTLKKRKAVCEGYSMLYKKLCDLTGVECVVINGTAKTTTADIGKKPSQSDHAWNAIKLNKQWHLVDVTWGAGQVDYNSKKFKANYREVYFMTPPNLFFLNHYPEDTKWLLVNKSEKDFTNLPLFYPDYLTSPLDILTPKQGVITKASKGKIYFKLKNYTSSAQLSFAFHNDKHSTILKGETKNNLTSFEIPTHKRKRVYLTIYRNNKAIVTYRLKMN